MATGYEDLEKLEKNQDEILNQQGRTQSDIINQQTQIQIDELNRNKEKIDKETDKTNRALYTQYQKESNQFGSNAETLATKGLTNSGYAETTKSDMFGTYQKNVTETLNNARDLKSDYDFKVAQARQNGSVQQAQAQLEIYAQKLQYLTQNYQLRQNREQYLYQQDRDKISDEQWQKTYDEQIRQNELENEWKQKQYDYQVQRDAVSDEQWQKQYNLSSRGRSSSGSSSSSSSSGGYVVNSANDGISIAEKLYNAIISVRDSGNYDDIPEEQRKEAERNQIIGRAQANEITLDEANMLCDRLDLQYK